MKRAPKDIRIFQKIIERTQQQIFRICESWNIYEKQFFFVNAISIYDRFFINSISEEKEEDPFIFRIIEYSYPVFIRQFYDAEFCSLPGIALKAMNRKQLEQYSKLIYLCGTIGWMQSFIDNINAGYYSSRVFFNYVRVKFTEKFHWNEYLEQEYLTWYASAVAEYQKEQYDSLFVELPAVLDKLKNGVFIWKDAFLGYENDFDTEVFFQKHALLDAQQSVSWDMFPPESIFGSVQYGDIVHSLVEFSGYAIKHLYCARILLQDHKELLFENLLSCFFVEHDIIKLISENRSCSAEMANNILKITSLSPDTTEYYQNGQVRGAPLIKVSSHQYARSIRGLLDDPFSFMLYNLRKAYPKDWDRNVNSREKYFRSQLYELFNEKNFCCIEHPVIIKQNGKVLTDIDAVVIDISSGEVGLFQLKWQDPADYSPFALSSKRSNYNEQTEAWIKNVTTWLDENSEAQIANILGMKARFLKKDNVKLFILGRRHGNYSGNNLPDNNCVWSQWYQLLHASAYLQSDKILTIGNLYDLLEKTTPFSRPILESTNRFVVGKYHIHVGGH